MNSRVGSFVRIALPMGILFWLCYRLMSQNPAALSELFQRPKDWPRLGLAFVVYTSAVMLTFVRWYLLVRALRLPFRISDAVRLGFVGFLLQFVSLGAVGGDLFKALFIAREQPSRKAEAVATVFIDRVVGLLGLLILASVVLCFGRHSQVLSAYSSIATVIFMGTAIGVSLFLLLLFTRFSVVPVAGLLRRMRPLRQAVLRIEGGIKLYRARRLQVLAAIGLAVVTHLMQAAAIYLAATSFFPSGPGWADQVVMWVISGSVAALPISPGGLGTFELTYQWLYKRLAATLAVPNEGILVALLYRLMSLSTAGMGVAVYLVFRRDLAEILRANQQAAARSGSD